MVEVDGQASTDAGARAVHKLCRNHNLTSYDAAYLELAIRQAIPLATLDADLDRAARIEQVALI